MPFKLKGLSLIANKAWPIRKGKAFMGQQPLKAFTIRAVTIATAMAWPWAHIGP